ncbi:MAG TPA: hypothetical protein PLI97_00350, partial [Fluviicola sp.]|nr:hypothetical protein [Fluviicola sp.]
KLKKFHALKYLFLAYMVVVPCWMLFMNWFFNLEPMIKQIFTKENLFDFPHVWSFTTYCASFFNILLAVIIVIITTNEIQYRTMRQNIIDGLTKQQVILSKFFSIIFLSVLATSYTFLCAFVIGSISSGASGFYENIHLNSLYFIQTLGYFSFAFLFALIVKRSAIAIVTFIVYFPFETIVGNLISKDLYQFFPLKVYADLTPTPFFKGILKMQEEATNQTIFVLDMNTKVILALVYTTLCFFGTYLILKKRDL